MFERHGADERWGRGRVGWGFHSGRLGSRWVRDTMLLSLVSYKSMQGISNCAQIGVLGNNHLMYMPQTAT